MIEKEFLEKLIKEKRSSYAIAKLLRKSQSNVKYWASKYGIKFPRVGTYQRTLGSRHRNEKDWSSIQKFHDKGNSWRKIRVELYDNNKSFKRRKAQTQKPKRGCPTELENRRQTSP